MAIPSLYQVVNIEYPCTCICWMIQAYQLLTRVLPDTVSDERWIWDSGEYSWTLRPWSVSKLNKIIPMQEIKRGPPLAILIEGAVHILHSDSYGMMTLKIGIANMNLDPFCWVLYVILPCILLIRDSWLQCFDCDVAACVLSTSVSLPRGVVC